MILKVACPGIEKLHNLIRDYAIFVGHSIDQLEQLCYMSPVVSLRDS